MPRGGARPGAGRPKGSKNLSISIDKPILDGIQPLDFLLSLVANPDVPPALRFEAAKAAAPYVHRKLAPLPAPKSVEDDPRVLEDAGWEDDLAAVRPN